MRFGLPGKPSVRSRPTLTILKMIFNFNFKDSPRAPEASIRRLTTACDRDHTVESPARTAFARREKTAGSDAVQPPGEVKSRGGATV